MTDRNDQTTEEREALASRFSGPEGQKERARLEKATEHYTGVLQEMSALAARQSPFCARGCAHCCCHTFHTTKGEVELIVLYLLKHRDLLAIFLENYRRREETVEPLADLMERCNRRDSDGSRANVEFYAKKVPCAFLQNNECIIYPVRPLTCASFVSIIPPRICALEPKAAMSGPMQQVYGKTLAWLKTLAGTDSSDDLADISRKVYQALQPYLTENK